MGSQFCTMLSLVQSIPGQHTAYIRGIVANTRRATVRWVRDSTNSGRR